jgi:hypothetical protein
MPHSGVFNVVTNSMYVPPGVRLRPPVLKVSSCGAGELGLKTTLWKRIGPTPSPVPGRNWIKSALRLIFEFLGLSNRMEKPLSTKFPSMGTVRTSPKETPVDGKGGADTSPLPPLQDGIVLIRSSAKAVLCVRMNKSAAMPTNRAKPLVLIVSPWRKEVSILPRSTAHSRSERTQGPV